MNEKENLEYKYVEEFELVNSENENIYTEKDIFIKPIMSKDGRVEFLIYNKDQEQIGAVDSNKNVTFTGEYIEDKKDEIDFSSNDIKADIKAILDKQKEKENNKEEQTETIEQENEEKEKNEKQEEKDQDQEEESPIINDEELKDQGFNISAYSRIIDKNIIDAMKPGTVQPRSVIVAEVDGQFKFLGKEKGTGNIVELRERPGGNNRVEEVNEFNNGVEEKKGRGRTMIMADYGNMEFSIKKNNYGQIDIGYIRDMDNNGNRELISVQTDIVHPTMEEYKRAQMEKYENYGYKVIDKDAILTENEIKERLAQENESVRNAVKTDLENQDKNPTLNKLEEIIQNEKAENEKNSGDEKEEYDPDNDENWGRYGTQRPH